MKYPSPKIVLSQIAARGPSAVRLEALRRLSDCPDAWPDCPRRSRLSLLRQLACDGKKSAKARLEAMKDLLAAMPAIPADEEAARREVDRILADVAREMGMTLEAKPAIPAPVEAPKGKPNLDTRKEGSSPASHSVSLPGVSSPESVRRKSSTSEQSVATQHEELPRRGYALAERILAQRQRCEMALTNREELHQLDRLQGMWTDFEKEATAAGLNLQEFEFDLAKLRPFTRKVNIAQERRRLFAEHELDGAMRARLTGDLPSRSEAGNRDGGMWSGTVGI